MPGWPSERTFVQSGESKTLDTDGLRAALAEADESGVDLANHLNVVLAPWPGWSFPPKPA